MSCPASPTTSSRPVRTRLRWQVPALPAPAFVALLLPVVAPGACAAPSIETRARLFDHMTQALPDLTGHLP